MIIYNSRFPRWFGFDGITLWPFIFIAFSKEDCPDRLRHHEEIHLGQQLAWLLVGFYIVYVWDYLVGRIKGLNDYEAYRAIRFEVEARKKAGA